MSPKVRPIPGILNEEGQVSRTCPVDRQIGFLWRFAASRGVAGAGGVHSAGPSFGWVEGGRNTGGITLRFCHHPRKVRVIAGGDAGGCERRFPGEPLTIFFEDEGATTIPAERGEDGEGCDETPQTFAEYFALRPALPAYEGSAGYTSAGVPFITVGPGQEGAAALVLEHFFGVAPLIRPESTPAWVWLSYKRDPFSGKGPWGKAELALSLPNAVPQGKIWGIRIDNRYGCLALDSPIGAPTRSPGLSRASTRELLGAEDFATYRQYMDAAVSATPMDAFFADAEAMMPPPEEYDRWTSPQDWRRRLTLDDAVLWGLLHPTNAHFIAEHYSPLYWWAAEREDGAHFTHPRAKPWSLDDPGGLEAFVPPCRPLFQPGMLDRLAPSKHAWFRAGERNIPLGLILHRMEERAALPEQERAGAWPVVRLEGLRDGSWRVSLDFGPLEASIPGPVTLAVAPDEHDPQNTVIKSVFWTDTTIQIYEPSTARRIFGRVEVGAGSDLVCA